MDLAELILSKLETYSNNQEPATAESLADLCFEIGRDQADKSRPAESLQWLTKGYDTIAGQDLDELSNDAPELQFSIMHRMVKVLIHLQSEENTAKAWNLVGDLSSRYGDKLAVLLLKLDLYALDPAFPPQDYCDVLHKIVRTVHLTDTNVKTALHHIHKLRTRDARMAHIVLVSLLMERLVGTEDFTWLEKALITIIWNCTTSSAFEDALDRLSEVLNDLHAEVGKAISPSATHAAQIVSPVTAGFGAFPSTQYIYSTLASMPTH